MKLTKTKISFYGAQWLRIHEPNQEKSFHTSHFPSNCEIFENRSKLVELNFLKHQIDLTWKNSWWWSLKFKVKQDNLFLNKKCCNEFLNFHEYWFKHLHHMHNIRICIFLEDICKIRNFHLHHHLVAFTSICPCWGKHLHHKHIHLHLHPHEGHLHYKKFSFALSYGCLHVCISDKDFLH